MSNSKSIDNNEIVVVKQKRGRKPKNPIINDNILISIEETNDKPIINDIICDSIQNNETDENNENDNTLNTQTFLFTDSNSLESQKPVGKKRGRKPKGGKIIQQITPLNVNKETKPSIILHLKCSMKDLKNSTFLDSNIESFHFGSNNDLSYEIINSDDNDADNNTNNFHINNDIINDSNKYIDNDQQYTNLEDDNPFNKYKDSDIREIWKKIKVLEHKLHINNISDKKSACFWCTYDFDNPPIYIPKYNIKESYHVYGCFCSPECATAYLMEENIDSSAKFERYHLLNLIYSKIYDYNKNIKPAPNPYYMLDKYYGNLSIQEYRSLLRNERLFLIVDKPLTRILPELHEDNDDFIINNKIIPSSGLQNKKKIQKKNQTKNTILNEKFGLSTQ